MATEPAMPTPLEKNKNIPCNREDYGMFRRALTRASSRSLGTM